MPVDLLTHRIRIGQFAACQERARNPHRNANTGNSDMHRRLWDHPFVTAGFVVVVLLPMILAIGNWTTPTHGSSASATPDVVMADRMPIPSVRSSRTRRRTGSPCSSDGRLVRSTDAVVVWGCFVKSRSS